VGATVEAKTPDGQFMEGIITKLTDASVYTVGKFWALSFVGVYIGLSILPLNEILITFLYAFPLLVFDDGDERTLRRTSLCLKGERHFNESEVFMKNTIILFDLKLIYIIDKSMNEQFPTKISYVLTSVTLFADFGSSSPYWSRKFWYSSCAG